MYVCVHDESCTSNARSKTNSLTRCVCLYLLRCTHSGAGAGQKGGVKQGLAGRLAGWLGVRGLRKSTGISSSPGAPRSDTTQIVACWLWLADWHAKCVREFLHAHTCLQSFVGVCVLCAKQGQLQQRVATESHSLSQSSCRDHVVLPKTGSTQVTSAE